MKETLLLIIVSIAATVAMPLVTAQQTYTQPMYTVDWGSSRTITLDIPAQPAWAYDELLEAIQTWNGAQQWFVASYYPNQKSAVFVLEPTNNSNAMVEIVYVQTSIVYCGYPPVSNTIGCTSESGRYVQFALPSLDSRIAAHELGHVLGLGDTPLSGDLMNFYRSDVNPSTLDLYAVFTVAESGAAQTGDSVTLPSTIPYMFWSYGMKPIPEFPSSSPVLLGVLLLPSILAFGIRKWERREA